MKILFVDWESYGNEDVKEAIIAEGFEMACFSYTILDSTPGEKLHHDPEMEHELQVALRREAPDAVFSVNFFPTISRVCQKEKIRYISWNYDSPCGLLYSDTIVNPCNTVYIFDKDEQLEFQRSGIKTVHYLPLAANTDRLDRIGKGSLPVDPFIYDVSFVGSLYLEKGSYFDRMEPSLSDYVKGYLKALIAAQLKVQGCDLIQGMLSPVMNELFYAYPIKLAPGSVEPREFFYEHHVVKRMVTAIERMDILEAAAQGHKVDLFTHMKSFSLPNVCNHGRVDYEKEMPLVFKQSKINLNITLRSIRSGVPLRAFDIMGSGGFLLSNFQADFLDLFVPGEDFVYYENEKDLKRKIDYYLVHEEERLAIARNGHDKIASRHTYRHRIKEMFGS